MIKPWGKSIIIGSAVFFFLEILRFDIIIVMFETKLYLEAKPSCTNYCLSKSFQNLVQCLLDNFLCYHTCLNNMLLFISDHLMTANMDPCLYCPSQSIFKINFIYNNQN